MRGRAVNLSRMSVSPANHEVIDRQAATALAYSAVALTLLEFYAMPWKLLAKGVGRDWFVGASDLGAGMAWVAATTALLVVAPLLIQVVVFRTSPKALGWSVAGFSKHVLVYLGLFAVMIPFIWWASGQADFRSTYPFIASARTDKSIWLKWECAYLFQFLAVESFFRGYLLFACERAMGKLAIFVAALPYTMIHFHKPLPECLGASAAGLILGWLALRFRSFWGGVLLHASVALTMDFLAVSSSGLFGK